MAFAAGSGVETSTYFMPEIVEASAVRDGAPVALSPQKSRHRFSQWIWYSADAQ